jgi:ubiquinone/menaquinone biosynthesis C-methylase UbiE
MLSEIAFNFLASDYDRNFGNSLSGQLQRKRVHRLTLKHLPEGPLNILEINCGTGIDALWLARQGHKVEATDASAEMIRVAKEKIGLGIPGRIIHTGKPMQAADLADSVEFKVCAFDKIGIEFPGRKFDVIFSDFGGLNCINEEELRNLNRTFKELLEPNGKLILVLMANNCWIEKLYFYLKKDKENMHRRMADSKARLKENLWTEVHYFSAEKLQNIFNSFSLNTKRAVGLFYPPSYLEKMLRRLFFLVPLLAIFERIIGSISSLADRGDHIFLVMQRKKGI